jgi:hypothetical protein
MTNRFGFDVSPFINSIFTNKTLEKGYFNYRPKDIPYQTHPTVTDE